MNLKNGRPDFKSKNQSPVKGTGYTNLVGTGYLIL